MARNQPENKASLSYRLSVAALKTTATYLWPFTAGRWSMPKRPTLKEAWDGTKKFAGKSLRLTFVLAAVFTANQIIQPVTGRLFPSAEEYLKAQGLDPEIATELSDNRIYVRHNDFWGRAHAFGEIPTIIGGAVSLYLTSMEENAFAFPGIRWGEWGHAEAHPILNQCHVMLQAKDVTALKTVSLLSGLSPNYIENLPITDQESRVAVAMHEFAHCHTQNRDNISLGEGDADVRGVGAAAEAFNNPEISLTFKYARALRRSYAIHDTALYTDRAEADADGRKPTSGEIKRSTQDIFSLAQLYRSANTQKISNAINAQTDNAFIARPQTYHALAIKGVLAEYNSLIDDSTQRRGELYIEAVKYFMPSQAKYIDNFDPLDTNQKAHTPAP